MATRPNKRRAGTPVFSQDFLLGSPPGLPGGAFWTAAAASLNVSRSVESAASAYASAAAKAHRAYVKQLRAAVGARNLRKYLEFRRNSKQELRAAKRKLAGTVAGRRELARIRRALVAKSLEFFKTQGINTRRIRQLQKKFNRNKRVLLQTTLERGIGPSRRSS